MAKHFRRPIRTKSTKRPSLLLVPKVKSLTWPRLSRVGQFPPEVIRSHTVPGAPDWYNAWLSARFRTLPTVLFDVFQTNREHCDEAVRWDRFLSAYDAISKCITSTKSMTVDGIIGQLQDNGVLKAEMTSEHLGYSRYLVFNVLGWQTMLFKPVVLDNIPSPLLQLAIDEGEGCCPYTHMYLLQDTHACAQSSLSELLMGFGILLPSKNACLDDNEDVQREFHQRLELNTRTFNVYSLISIAGIRIRWVDSLSCHLEFNSVTNELSIFQFPSFCQQTLLAFQRGTRGALHACATTSRLRCQWATEDDINHFLLETLLSYRLLFGQSPKSRRIFRSLDPFLLASKESCDPLLSKLCLVQRYNDPHLAEREIYHLPRDFPVLRYRIIVLQRYLTTKTPRTLMQLWRDKRDSANWLTFWAVIVFGAFGSLMALLQVILQLVQLLQ